MPQVRKRRKISLVMSPAEYDEAQEDVDMDKSDAQVKDIIDQLKKKEPVALGDKGTKF